MDMIIIGTIMLIIISVLSFTIVNIKDAGIFITVMIIAIPCLFLSLWMFGATINKPKYKNKTCSYSVCSEKENRIQNNYYIENIENFNYKGN